MNAEGIRFVDFVAVVPRDDVVLVLHPFAHVRDEAFPDSRRSARLEILRLGIPAVPVADDAHRSRVRRPNGEKRSGDAVVLAGMRAELLPKPVMAAFIEEVVVPIR